MSRLLWTDADRSAFARSFKQVPPCRKSTSADERLVLLRKRRTGAGACTACDCILRRKLLETTTLVSWADLFDVDVGTTSDASLDPDVVHIARVRDRCATERDDKDE